MITISKLKSLNMFKIFDKYTTGFKLYIKYKKYEYVSSPKFAKYKNKISNIVPIGAILFAFTGMITIHNIEKHIGMNAISIVNKPFRNS